MFEKSSRYAGIETATLTVTGPDGTERELRYIRRRFIPVSADWTTLTEHRVAQGERLDLITARYLGDPLQFWRVCDANDVLRPDELEEPDRVVRVAVPQI